MNKKITPIPISELSYEQLTRLHLEIKNQINEMNRMLNKYGNTPLSELNQDLKRIIKLRQLMIKLRLIIRKAIFDLADSVKLPQL